MAALDFEPRGRPGLLRRASVVRLVVLAAVVAALTIAVWVVVPSGTGPTTRPVSPAGPPVRPIPASLPVLTGEEATVLAQARDGEPVRDLPFYYLLKRAADARDTPPAEPINVEAEQVVAHPATFRGRLVRLRGVFLRDYPVSYPENLAGVREARTGEIGSDGGTIVTFVLPGSNAGPCRLGDTVAMTGYFLQVRRFTSGEDGRSHSGPLILATSLERLSTGETVSAAWVAVPAILVALVIGVMTVAVLVSHGRQRKRRAAYTAWRDRVR